MRVMQLDLAFVEGAKLPSGRLGPQGAKGRIADIECLRGVAVVMVSVVE
jgi:hypothetical protein